MRLEAGQVAVVTGGASGIGLALSQELAARGLAVAVVDVDRDALDQAVEQITSAGGRGQGFVTDVSSAVAVDELATSVTAEFGRVDLLCSNAGVLARRTVVWDVPERDVSWLFDVNVFGVYNMLRSFLPMMIEQGRGHVVHTASNVGLDGIPGLGLYGATKHAVVGLTYSLMAELAHTAPGTGVTLLCPGGTRTNLQQAEQHRPPDSLGPAGAAALETPPRWALAARPEPDRIPAEDVARQVVVAIERDQRLVVTDDDAVAGIRSWLAGVTADLDRSPAPVGRSAVADVH